MAIYAIIGKMDKHRVPTVKQLIIVLISISIISLAHAESTRYVVDQTRISLRTGTSTKNKVLQWLPTGMALTILEVSEDRNYSRVRTPGGTEGWVQNLYLMDNPPARDRLATAEKQLVQKSEQILRLNKQLEEATSIKGQTEKERNSLNEQNALLSKELAEIRRVSANAVQMSEENKTLRSQVTTMEQEIQLLKQENDSLGDRSARNWFMTGAVVVIISMLFGILLTRIRWRKKSSWGEL